MTTLFTTTFETALTGADGFTTVGTNPTLDTTSAIKGVNSARWDSVTSGVGTLQPASDQNTVYLSFYITFNTIAAAPRFLRFVDNTGITSLNLVINSVATPSVKLRHISTTIGTSATVLSANTIYRIGLKFVKSSVTDAADGVAELYIATGDTAFGAAAVSSSTLVLNYPIDKIEFGPTNSTSVDCWIDNIIWSDSAMPAASGGGAFPSGPTGLAAAVASATSINLTWTDNASNETAFTVERATNPAGPWTTLTSALAVDSVAYTATGLTTSTTYYFRVKATNASGSSAYSNTASATPLSIGNWNWTELAWPYRERYQPIILAATAGTGYIALTTDDPTNPSAAYTYYSGPLDADGETLTLAASQSAAQTAAVALPTDGRWLLPSVTEARAVRLYHRHTAAYTVREFYPFRVVEADQVSAEFIRGMYISGHQLIVDELSALSANLGIVTAGTFQTAVSGARYVMTADAYGGIIGYDADDNYDTTTGAGSYQILLNKADGKLYAAAGAIIMDDQGLTIDTDNSSSGEAVRWTGGSLGTLVSINASYNVSSRILNIKGPTSTIASFNESNVGALSATMGGDLIVTGALRSFSGDLTVSSPINAAVADAATNASTIAQYLGHSSSSTPAAGFGVQTRYQLESSTTAAQNAAAIDVSWVVATHASRRAQVTMYAYDSAAARVFLVGGASGTAAMIGFLGAPPVARPTVSGSKGANAALTSLMSALSSLGLVTDSTT